MLFDDRRSVAVDVFSKREAILLALAAVTVAATLTGLLSRLTLDDAYITFRYARHLAEGYGLGAWNHTGEHVEGYSSPLWMRLIAGAGRRRRQPRLRSSDSVQGVQDRGGADRDHRAHPPPRRSSCRAGWHLSPAVF